MSTYIGITLGPIARVMSYTQSTRSFWAASYFFTYLAKKIIEPFISTEDYSVKRPFLKPQIQPSMWTIRDGVGRFPDQYIFQAQPGDFEKLRARIPVVFAGLGRAIAQKTDETREEKIVDYLKSTIKVYVLEKKIDEKEKKEIVDEFQQAFSYMECQDRFPTKESFNYLFDFFDKVIGSELTLDAFGKHPVRMFDTIIECAASQAVNKKLIERRCLFQDNEVEKLPSHYKYIAFVAADGDHVGKALLKFGDTMGAILIEFNRGVKTIVHGYGGQVVYQGGDDLVFFAPVENIFSLIKEIDTLFQDNVRQKVDGLYQEMAQAGQKEEELPKRPSLSFGVSISYYKHPMAEAIALADSLLEKAKDSGRNRIAWNIRKHSGQSIQAVFDKNHPEVYAILLDILEKAKKEEEIFLHSLIHYLLLHQSILIHILSKGKEAKACLENYMESSFDDAEHVRHKPFMEQARSFLLEAVRGGKTQAEEAIPQLQALLKYVELIIKKN